MADYWSNFRRRLGVALFKAHDWGEPQPLNSGWGNSASRNYTYPSIVQCDLEPAWITSVTDRMTARRTDRHYNSKCRGSLRCMAKMPPCLLDRESASVCYRSFDDYITLLGFLPVLLTSRSIGISLLILFLCVYLSITLNR